MSEGINLLEKTINEGVDVFQVAQEKLKDGYQWTDAVAIAMEAKDLWFITTDWSEIKAQFKDLDSEEIEQLVLKLVKELGIANEKALNLIQKSINFLSSGYELAVAIKELKN